MLVLRFRRVPAAAWARRLSSSRPEMKPEQIDAAIREMNEEMAELFGDPSLASPTQPSPLPSTGSIRPSLPATEERPTTAPSAEAGRAVAALKAHLDVCSEQLEGLNGSARTMGLRDHHDQARPVVTAMQDIAHAIVSLQKL